MVFSGLMQMKIVQEELCADPVLLIIES